MRTVLATAAAVASLPHAGVLVPGHSLAGVRIGEPAAQVQAALGAHGVCSGCATTTWYFTYGRFTQPGLAVELTDGKVSAVYTIWQPPGWKGPRGLELGAPEVEVAALAGSIVPFNCPGYTAWVIDVGRVRTAYYVVDGKLWGFGLVRAPKSPCR
jgi:hypothetical protein